MKKNFFNKTSSNDKNNKINNNRTKMTKKKQI